MSYTGPGCQERDKGGRRRGEKTGSFTRKNCKPDFYRTESRKL